MQMKVNLEKLVSDLVADGVVVVAPARAHDGGLDFARVHAASSIVLSDALPRIPLKQMFLPATEPLLTWERRGTAVEIGEVPTTFQRRVVIGAHPCDAAALEIVDKVMDWNYHDELWFGRRAATTIITLACDSVKPTCMCDSVGLAPDATRGADIALTRDGEILYADVVSEKGTALLSEYPAAFAGDEPTPKKTASTRAAALPADPHWLDGRFDDPLWRALSLACNGCGACASVCPTCHCFDIVDEPESVGRGTRRRNWDACQYANFTVHASGHNPRPEQSCRMRQRISHKFSIYRQKFGETLCTGCGRCMLYCPAGIDLQDVLQKLQARGVTS